jgi:PAS domain S-box-containing protein
MSQSFEEPVDLLLVDDRVEDLLTLTQVLDSPEYRLSTASSGPEALKRLLEQDFGVILLDVFMPEMDGFELAALIKQRERSQHTPIIFLTAAGSDMPRIYRGYSVGAVDYLTKPVDPDVVRAKVAVFADLFRKDRRLERNAKALHEGERRQREAMLSELRHAAERRYMNLAEAVPLGVWTAASSGELTYANRYWTEYTGIPLEAARGMGWADAVHTADRDGYVQAYREAIEKGAPFQQECRMRRAGDGAHRWHVTRAIPEHSDAGQIVSWLGTHADIEESKQAVLARDEFLSIASHELRTPLTALKLRLQAVLHSRDLSEKAERRVESAVRQTERLERLIDNLLDVSRITTGHLELEPEEFDLAEMAQEVAERFREQAAGVALSFEASEPVLGCWDRLRLEQVVSNLLANALKYGEGKPVLVRVSAQPSSAVVSVADHGIGIAPQDLSRIFNQFERVLGRRTFGGLGMGLYIARQIAQAHGGRIEVDSAQNRGSNFRVVLPR